MMMGMIAVCGVLNAQPLRGVSNIKIQDGIVYRDVDFGHTKGKLGMDCRSQYSKGAEERVVRSNAYSTKLRIDPYLKRHATLASTVGVLCSHKASHEAAPQSYPHLPGAAYSTHYHLAYDENGNLLLYYWLATRGGTSQPVPHFDNRHHRRRMSPYGTSRAKSRSRSGGVIHCSSGGGFRRRR